MRENEANVMVYGVRSCHHILTPWHIGVHSFANDITRLAEAKLE